MKLQIALIRFMNSFTDTPCEVDVRGGNQHFAIFFLGRHDPLQRVFGFFLFLEVLYQMHDFIAVFL